MQVARYSRKESKHISRMPLQVATCDAGAGLYYLQANIGGRLGRIRSRDDQSAASQHNCF